MSPFLWNEKKLASVAALCYVVTNSSQCKQWEFRCGEHCKISQNLSRKPETNINLKLRAQRELGHPKLLPHQMTKQSLQQSTLPQNHMLPAIKHMNAITWNVYIWIQGKHKLPALQANDLLAFNADFAWIEERRLQGDSSQILISLDGKPAYKIFREEMQKIYPLLKQKPPLLWDWTGHWQTKVQQSFRDWWHPS